MTVRTTVDHAVRQDVADVLVRYATAIDFRDWELFRSCFAEDCVADYGNIGLFHGADEVTQWAIEQHAALGQTMHRITNQVVWPNGDGVKARSYYDTIVADTMTKLRTHAAGHYDDELVHTDDGWKISRRTVTMVWVDTTVKLDQDAPT